MATLVLIVFPFRFSHFPIHTTHSLIHHFPLFLLYPYLHLHFYFFFLLWFPPFSSFIHIFILFPLLSTSCLALLTISPPLSTSSLYPWPYPISPLYPPPSLIHSLILTFSSLSIFLPLFIHLIPLLILSLPSPLLYPILQLRMIYPSNKYTANDICCGLMKVWEQAEAVVSRSFPPHITTAVIYTF